MLEEKHTLNKDENQNLQIPKTENQKKTKKQKKQQQTERKALVQKDFLICPGSVQYSILLHAKHFPFQSGFPFFSFPVRELQNIYFSIILYSLHFLPKSKVLQLIPHAGYLPTSFQLSSVTLLSITTDSVSFNQPGVADGWGLLL